MSVDFEEDFLQILTAIHFPSGDFATLHFDFQWESFHESSYTANMSAVPKVIGMLPDMRSQLVIFPPPKLQKSKPFWAIEKSEDITTHVIGGTITVVDIGTYYPEFSWHVGTAVQSALVTVSPYHGVILPLIIGTDPDIAPPGGFTPEGARAILANLQAHFDQDNGVNTFNAAWKLASVISSHTEGGSAVATRIEFKDLYIFNLSKIKSANKNSRFLKITLNLQGQSSQELANYWTAQMDTFKKPKDMPVSDDYYPLANGQVDSLQFHHEFNESDHAPFFVNYTIDLKTLKITGNTNG